MGRSGRRSTSTASHFHSAPALDLGYPITAVAGRNGHDPSMLLKVYSHHLEQTDRRISEAVAALVRMPKRGRRQASAPSPPASTYSRRRFNETLTMPPIRSTGIGNSPREHSRYAVDTPMPNSCAASDIDSVKHSVPVRDPLSRCRASGGAGAHPSPSGSGSWCPQDENGAASSARAGGRPRACRPSRPLPAGERSGRRLPWPHNLASRDEGKLNWAKGSCDRGHACRHS